MAGVSITLPESVRVEIPGEHIRFFGVAVNAGSNPIVRLMCSVACERNEMINLPRSSLSDAAIIVERKLDSAIEALAICSIIPPVYIVISIGQICLSSGDYTR
jgi:hypothetical protein